jgi:hypothetical protein
MQTAVGVFGGEAYTDGVSVPPLMVANTGNSDHPAISSLNCPPFLTVELCRERLVCHGTSRYCRAFFSAFMYEKLLHSHHISQHLIQLLINK